MKRSLELVSGVLAVVVLSGSAAAGEWREWGGGPSKNMISAETGLPVAMAAGEEREDSRDIDPATTENCKWVVTLGSEAYGTATIGSGLVLVGTNNEGPRNAALTGDRGVILAFAEETGEFRWQFSAPKLPGGDEFDWEYLGICSSTAIRGDLGYVVTNRCELVCLDLNGLADGNAGFAEEGAYLAGPGNEPLMPGPNDADIVWIFDMRKGVGALPHNIASSSPTVVGGRVFTSTTSGIDGDHEKFPAPDAPCLIALAAKDGSLLGRETAGIGTRTFHSNWSSPCVGTVAGKEVVFFGGGDGFLYAFDAVPVDGGEKGRQLHERWRHDANPEEYRLDDDGEKRDYPTFKGPSEVVGTPVFVDGKVYVTIGQDPENGDGVGMLSCVDAATGKADWTYREINRSLSTASVTGGLLYIADYSGKVHCLEAATGKVQWVHDTLSRIWGSTLVADGKVHVGTEDGELIILKAGRTLEELATVSFLGPIYSSPVAANGTLYIQTQSHLYAFRKE